MVELLLTGVLLLSAFGVGQMILCRLHCTFGGRRTPEALFAVALGLGALAMLMLGLGLSHLLYRWLIVSLVGVWFVVGLRPAVSMAAVACGRIHGFRLRLTDPEVWALLLAGLGLGLLLLRALAPPHGSTDPLAYQLALPKIFLRHHYLSFERTITGALYPTNMGLLYLVGMALRNGIVAQILHWSMAAMSAWAVWALTREYFADQAAAIWAAAIFSFIPIGVVYAPQGYVDLGLCFFQLMAFWALLRWCQSRAWADLLLAALLAGLTMGVKHLGMVNLLLGGATVFLVSWRRQGVLQALRPTAAYVAVAVTLVLPWYLRAYLLAGNPVWPLANGFFGGIAYGPGSGGEGAQSFDVVAGHWWEVIIPPGNWWSRYGHAMSPWSWTFSPPGWQKNIGIYFVALLPGVILLLRQPRVRWLLLASVGYLWLLIRYLHMNPRYGLVLLAALSVLCGLVIQRLTHMRVRPLASVFRLAILGSFVLNLAWAYALARPLLAVAVGIESRDTFLRRNEGNWRLFQHVNTHVPADARILLQGIVKGYYCERDYLWDHPYQSLLRYDKQQMTAALLQRFRVLGITHVARMIRIPSSRLQLGYPQYFMDPYHEEFRQRYLLLVYRDESYVLFRVNYEDDTISRRATHRADELSPAADTGYP